MRTETCLGVNLSIDIVRTYSLFFDSGAAVSLLPTVETPTNVSEIFSTFSSR